MTGKVRFVVRGMCVGLILAQLAVRADSDNAFRQGNQLREQLIRRRSVAVESVLLRDLLQDIQTESGICVILDRCIDPATRMSITTPLVRTDELLGLVSDKVPNADVSVGQDLIYFGPSKRSEMFRTLVESNRTDLRNLRRAYSREDYTALTARSELEWPDLATPRNIMTKLASDAGLGVANPEVIPHDLWRSGRLPRLSFVEAATLLLIQFDLTVEIQPELNTCAIVHIPTDIAIEKQHSIPRQMRESAQSLIEVRMPGLNARWARSQVRVRGTVEEHEQVMALFGSRSADELSVAAKSLKTRVLTLSIPDGLTYRQVIAQLQQSGITIRVEATLGPQLDAKVSVNLKSLAGEEFFAELFRELSVSVEVRDEEVVLRDPGNEN